MSELLVRAASKTLPRLEDDAKQGKRGDVVHIAEDGHVWGELERTLPQFRILTLPGVTVDHFAMLLSEEAALSQAPDLYLQARGFYLNLDSPAIAIDLATYIADDKRTEPMFTVRGPAAIEALVTQRTRLKNPNVIG